jgi:replicative DNA helicase
MRLTNVEVTAFELEMRVVGAVLARSDALYDLPAGFSSSILQHGTLRAALTGIERLSRTKKLPAGPIDHAQLIADTGLSDDARQVLLTAEHSVDDLATRGSTVRDHAQALLDRHRRAKTRAMLTRAVEALDGGAATDDIVAGVTATLLDIDHPDQPEVVSYEEAALQTIDAVEAIKQGNSKRLTTGFDRIDRILRIRPGNLVIVGARSKVGKTTFARQLADTVALQRKHVAFHSLEMSVPEVVALDLSRELSIDSTEFFDDVNNWTPEHWEGIQHAVSRRVPEGTHGYLHANHYHHGLGAILRISEKLHRKHGLSLVVVDYIQLVQLELGKNATREQVVATISRALKSFAQRTGVPVLALAQLNRESAKRGEKPWRPARKKAKPKADPMALPGVTPPPPPEPETPPEDEPMPPPQLHDLRESGALEQDANAVCFIHHPFDLALNPEKREHGPFNFIIAAQRLGPKGVVKLYADRKYSRFEEID